MKNFLLMITISGCTKVNQTQKNKVLVKKNHSVLVFENSNETSTASININLKLLQIFSNLLKRGTLTVLGSGIVAFCVCEVFECEQQSRFVALARSQDQNSSAPGARFGPAKASVAAAKQTERGQYSQQKSCIDWRAWERLAGIGCRGCRGLFCWIRGHFFINKSKSGFDCFILLNNIYMLNKSKFI